MTKATRNNLISLVIALVLTPFAVPLFWSWNQKGVVIGWLALLSFTLYLLPTYVAFDQKHSQRFSIGALNLFLGWTFLGWVAALVWALVNEGNQI